MIFRAHDKAGLAQGKVLNGLLYYALGCCLHVETPMKVEIWVAAIRLP
ncbi:MAG TPA: hypothetical protein VEK32_11755 [Thermodesulfobacteriota bacterium]|nr:hypothetical protein [Thermodesulfobacteriota bacterium]